MRLRDLAGEERIVGPEPRTESRYRVLERLGHDRRATTFLAYDQDLNRKVALKLARSGCRDVTRGHTREAQTSGRLEHQNIVPVHDIGATDGGRVYYAMRYVEGVPLAHTSTL